MPRVVAACLLALSVVAGVDAAEPRFPWPEGRRAAVSLSYDDALPTHLDNAIPALDRRGLKGSFYLTLAADTVRSRLEDWRTAARHGHELGNHSLFHQCSASLPDREWVGPAQDLDAVSVEQMRSQVLLANVVLQAIDGRGARTFTVPCGDRRAADGDYVEALAGVFLGIKLGQGGAVEDMWTLDLDAVPVTVPVDAGGEALVALVEDAGRKGTMINFTFHGIGGDHLAVSQSAHDALLDYLSRHRDLYWTATFGEQMRWVRDVRQNAAP